MCVLAGLCEPNEQCSQHVTHTTGQKERNERGRTEPAGLYIRRSGREEQLGGVQGQPEATKRRTVSAARAGQITG